MSFPGLKHGFAVAVLLAVGIVTASSAGGQEEPARKIRNRVEPTYPELARRMKITGIVKVAVLVAPSGTVKDAKVIGGHPVLATAALEAVKKWHFEVGPQETTETLQFRFDPSD